MFIWKFRVLFCKLSVGLFSFICTIYIRSSTIDAMELTTITIFLEVLAVYFVVFLVLLATPKGTMVPWKLSYLNYSYVWDFSCIPSRFVIFLNQSYPSSLCVLPCLHASSCIFMLYSAKWTAIRFWKSWDPSSIFDVFIRLHQHNNVGYATVKIL